MALAHTVASFTAFDGELPVGMVRVIGDDGMSFYLKDFAVISGYQGKGAGTLLMNSVEAFIRNSIMPGWAVSLELISTKEAVSIVLCIAVLQVLTQQSDAGFDGERPADLEMR